MVTWVNKMPTTVHNDGRSLAKVGTNGNRALYNRNYPSAHNSKCIAQMLAWENILFQNLAMQSLLLVLYNSLPQHGMENAIKKSRHAFMFVFTRASVLEK